MFDIVYSITDPNPDMEDIDTADWVTGDYYVNPFLNALGDYLTLSVPY